MADAAKVSRDGGTLADATPTRVIPSSGLYLPALPSSPDRTGRRKWRRHGRVGADRRHGAVVSSGTGRCDREIRRGPGVPAARCPR
jgi:hypothetical protein